MDTFLSNLVLRTVDVTTPIHTLYFKATPSSDPSIWNVLLLYPFLFVSPNSLSPKKNYVCIYFVIDHCMYILGMEELK